MLTILEDVMFYLILRNRTNFGISETGMIDFKILGFKKVSFKIMNYYNHFISMSL